MPRLIRALFVLFITALASPLAMAQACYVSEQTSGDVPEPVSPEKCFELQNMDDPNAMAWICRDQADVRSSRRELRDSCPSGAFGSCSAPMTPETLANEKSFGLITPDEALPDALPEDARIVTYYYATTDQGQTRIDCENTGGQWAQ